jgi:formate dehydrogenase major subunit
MQGDGRGWLFAPTGLKDGPLPTHYEPAESPLTNPLYRQAINPVADLWPRGDNRRHEAGDPRYPYVITTYRLTEHHTAGAMTRWLPWLAELQPALFCEIGSELASEKGVRNGDWVTISTARGEVEARALVTERIQPLRLGRRRVHQVGLPWHWGYQGVSRGDVANDLTALVADPNVTIHEAKAFTCDLRAGRRLARG